MIYVFKYLKGILLDLLNLTSFLNLPIFCKEIVYDQKLQNLS